MQEEISNLISLVFNFLPNHFKNKRKLIRLVEQFRVVHDLDEIIREFYLSLKNEIKILIVITFTSSLTYYFFSNYLNILNFFGIAIIASILISLILFLFPIALKVFYLLKNVKSYRKLIWISVSFTSILLFLLFFFTSILFGGLISTTITATNNITKDKIVWIIFLFIFQIIILILLSLYVISFHIDLYTHKLVAEINKRLEKNRRMLPLFLFKIENDNIKGKVIRIIFEREELEIITKDCIKYFIPLDKVSEFFGIKCKNK